MPATKTAPTTHPAPIQALLDLAKRSLDPTIEWPDRRTSTGLVPSTRRGKPVTPHGVGPTEDRDQPAKLRKSSVLFKGSKFLPDGVEVGRTDNMVFNYTKGDWDVENSHPDLNDGQEAVLRRYSQKGKFISAKEIEELKAHNLLRNDEIKKFGKATTTAAPVERIATMLTELEELRKLHPELVSQLFGANKDKAE